MRQILIGILAVMPLLAARQAPLIIGSVGVNAGTNLVGNPQLVESVSTEF